MNLDGAFGDFDQSNEDCVKEKLLGYMWQAIDGNLKSDQLIAHFTEIKENHKQIESLIADLICIIDVEVSLSDDQSRKEKFYSLIQQTLRQFVGDDLLKERLEIETLEALKLIGRKENFNQKYIKIKTRLFYKQQKFNLLREESEGYSKLVAELNQKDLTNRILQNIQSLIGCFNLDPNRVLDIILEAFENNCDQYNAYIELLKEYKCEQENICQVIGFKYQALHNLNVSGETGLYTDSLYLITSYLLKHEIISLEKLLPHLYPNDEEITQLHKDEFENAKQYAKKLTLVNLSANDDNNTDSNNKDSSSSGSNNSSATASSSTANPSVTAAQATATTTTPKNPQIENQRICLIDYLLKIGDCKTSMKLLEKLPRWYISTHQEVTQSICKTISKMIEPLYSNNNTFSDELKQKLLKSKEKLNNNNNNNNNSLLESVSTFQQFIDIILPIISSIGPGISYDTVLLSKIVRICIAFMAKKENDNSFLSISENNLFHDNIYAITNEVLLPSLSMLHMNPCISIEFWSLLKYFRYEMRYSLYNEWRLRTYQQFPQLIRVKADCQEKIKYLLKRLTKENVKIHGRLIGKLSHNNPIIVCDYILTQIQRYDNFIAPVVESLKFMTGLSYDVLSFCAIVQISDPDKEKMKHDSTNISSWLQSVASFCALVFKKYQIELTAIIQYVINQLKNRKCFDLLILQEIVQKMCGIEISSEATDLQLDAMTGGDLLRQEAGFFNQIRNAKKSSNRLKEALTDHSLILPLCILLSQQRDYIVFSHSSEDRHLKLTGSLYDQCQDSLVQFSQFLASTLTTDEYIHIFPKIDELVNTYHVSPDVAFFLSRPMYSHHIQSKYDELRRMDRNTKSADKPSKTQRYLEAIDIVMQPVVDLVRTLQPAKIWDDMSPLFYTSFWTLSCNDLAVPTQAYDKQRSVIKQKFNVLDDQELPTAKKKKEKDKLNILLDKLTEEENKQKDHVQHVRARLEKEKENWFPLKYKNKNDTITEFLQLCIFSRCLFTHIDAIYCAKFIQVIHSIKTPNFSTIICYDRIFSDISYSIASLTDNEARRYGRFLLGLLETVMHWHSDQDIFERECAQYPGFLTVFRNSNNTAANQTQQPTKQEPLDYENFRHVCHKWHYKLTKSFIVCLESDEYLQMRNALIILTKILPHYPKLTNFYSALDKRVDKIKQTEKEKRQDIYTLASVYLGQLRQRKSNMIEENRFHLKETPKDAKPAQQQQQSTQSQQPKSAQSQQTSSNPSKPLANGSSSTQQDQQFKQPSTKQQSNVQTSSSVSVGSTKSASSSSSQQTAQSSTQQKVDQQSTKSSSSSTSTSSSNVNITTNGSSSKPVSSSQASSSTKSSTSTTNKQQNSDQSSSKLLKHSNENGGNSPNSSGSQQQQQQQQQSTQQQTSNSKPTSKDSSSSNNQPSVNGNGSSRIVSLAKTSQSSGGGGGGDKQQSSQMNGTSSSKGGSSSSSSSSKKQHSYSNPSSVPPSESSAGGDDSNGSISGGEEISPKRTHRSSSRSQSPHQRRSSERGERKRMKTDEQSKGLHSGGGGGYSDSSSSKHKSSRDHDSKEKKEHRKREHSNELNDSSSQKRSKSDEKKKEKSPKRSSKRVESKDDLTSSSSSTSSKQTRDLDRRSPRDKNMYSVKDRK